MNLLVGSAVVLGLLAYGIMAIVVYVVCQTFDDPYNHKGRSPSQRVRANLWSAVTWGIWLPWMLIRVCWAIAKAFRQKDND